MIVDVETKVGDPVQRVLGRVDGHVPLGRVEHMRDPDLFQVLHVLNCLSVAQNDAWVYLPMKRLFKSAAFLELSLFFLQIPPKYLFAKIFIELVS